MGLAKTPHSVLPQWAAECEFHNMADGNPAPVLVPHGPLTELGFGYAFPTGEVKYTAFLYGVDSGFAVGVQAKIGGTPATYGTASAGGLWVRGASPPYAYTYTGSTTYSAAAVGSIGPLDLYKMRDAEPMPVFDNGPVDPCHPLHLGMKYAWGTDATYSISVDATLCAQTTSWPQMVASWSTGGGGTTDLLPLTIGLGLTRTPYGAMSGLVGKVVNVRAVWGGTFSYADFSDFDTTSNGLRCVGNGSSLELYCVTWSSVPLDGYAHTVTIYPPVVIDYDLAVNAWGQDYTGAELQIPDNEASGTFSGLYKVVQSPYAERMVYWKDSWHSGSERVWEIAPRLTTAWLASNSENVDPDDSYCTIEEHGLQFAGSEGSYSLYDWPYFQPVRNMTCSVQWPWDAVLMPSPWVSVGGGVSVEQVGRVTKVHVGPHVANDAIRRTLKDDYLSYRCTSAGADALGLPQAYQYLRHSVGNDICCWEDYKYLKLTYFSEASGVLNLTVRNHVVAMEDTHETDWGARKAAWLASIATTAEEHVFPFTILAAGGVVYIGLEDSTDRKLQHVYEIELGGFTNTGDSEWLFEIRDLELVVYNPTLGTETGKADVKVVYARPDAGGLPISYEAWTTTTEGSRAARPPDQFRALCGEEGLAFVEASRGSGTGIIGDHLKALSAAYQQLNRLEGFAISDTQQWATSASEYKGAFTDSSGSDMLLGNLYWSDIGECIDRQISSSTVTFPVRPRVGTLYPCAGYPLPCQVQHHILQGNIHGLVRNGSTRAGAQSVYLFERDGSGSITQIADCTTDDWGRFSFYGERGVRENCDGGVATTNTSSQVTQWFTDLRNELRRWSWGTSGSSALALDGASADRVAIARFVNGHLQLRVSYNGGTDWVDEDVVPVADGTSPSVVWSPCEGTEMWLFYVSGGVLYQRKRHSTSSSILKSGVSAARVIPKNRNNHICTLLYIAGSMLYSSDAHYISGTEGYEEDTETIREIDMADSGFVAGIMQPTGSLAVCYVRSGVRYTRSLTGNTWSDATIVPDPFASDESSWWGLSSPTWQCGRIPCAGREGDGTIAFGWFVIDSATGALAFETGSRHVIATASQNTGPVVWVNQSNPILVWYIGSDGALHQASSGDEGRTWTE